MGHPKKGNHHLPTIHFFQLNFFVSGRVYTPQKKTEEIAPELAQMIGRRILSSQNGPFLKGYGARFFLHLFTVLFGPLRARAFFDMLPLDHPPPGLCGFALCTSCGFCFNLPRDHPMFGVHLLSFAPLWVFLLNLFWARFRPSTRPRHAWGSLRFFAQGSFWTSFGPCFDLPHDHAMLGGHCKRFLAQGSFWTSFGPCFDLPHDHAMLGGHCKRFLAQGSFWTSFGPCFDLPRDHPMLGGHCGFLHRVLFGPLLGPVLTFHTTTPCLGVIASGFLHRVLFGPLLGPVLTFHATTPCLGFITVCTRFFLDLFWALF